MFRPTIAPNQPRHRRLDTPPVWRLPGLAALELAPSWPSPESARGGGGRNRSAKIKTLLGLCPLAARRRRVTPSGLQVIQLVRKAAKLIVCLLRPGGGGQAMRHLRRLAKAGREKHEGARGGGGRGGVGEVGREGGVGERRREKDQSKGVRC